MSDYGIIATSGVGVSGAADYQKLIDSRWKLLNIHNEFKGTIPLGEGYWSDYVIGEHGLGYAPMFTYRMISSKNMTSDERYLLFADSRYIYARAGANDWGMNYIIRVFDIDFIQNNSNPLTHVAYQASIEQSENVGEYGDLSQGIKITKDHKNIDSKELSDFNLNSASKILQIHQYGTLWTDQTAGINPRVWHYLGYPPSYLACTIYDSTQTAWDLPGSEQWITTPTGYLITKTLADNNAMWFSGVQSQLKQYIGYVIFKDPLELLA